MKPTEDVSQFPEKGMSTPEIGALGREVFRITHDGRMVCGEGLSTEEATQEAAKMLIASFEEQIQKMVDDRVANLSAEVERLKGCCDELHYIIDNGGYPSGKDYADMTARAEKAEAKIITARSALSRIANSDYRGNRSTESQIAFAALEASK
jgi:hypothetical protein